MSHHDSAEDHTPLSTRAHSMRTHNAFRYNGRFGEWCFYTYMLFMATLVLCCSSFNFLIIIITQNIRFFSLPFYETGRTISKERYAFAWECYMFHCAWQGSKSHKLQIMRLPSIAFALSFWGGQITNFMLWKLCLHAYHHYLLTNLFVFLLVCLIKLLNTVSKFLSSFLIISCVVLHSFNTYRHW